MHILLGLLGTLITVLILLNRLADAGIDLGGLNPFLWQRRRKWRQQYEGNPLYKIDSPMDATAILTVAAVKADGDMTREDKQMLLELFEKEFKLSRKDAAGLLISSTHLIGDGTELRSNIDKFLKPSLETFTPAQASAALTMIGQVSGNPGQRHPNAEQLFNDVAAALEAVMQSGGKW